MQIKTSKIMNKIPKKFLQLSSREHRKYRVQMTLYLRCPLDEVRTELPDRGFFKFRLQPLFLKTETQLSESVNL